MRRISSWVRERTTPSILVAIVALVAAMTGGAVAATNQTDARQDAKQINRALAASKRTDATRDATQIANYFNAHRSAGLMWNRPLDLLAGDPTVHTSFNAVNSGVGGGLSGLIVTSDNTGDVSGGGNKVIEKGVDFRPAMT